MKLFRKKSTIVLLLFIGSIKSQTFKIDHPIADMLDSLSSQKMFENAFSKPVFPKNNKYKYIY